MLSLLSILARLFNFPVNPPNYRSHSLDMRMVSSRSVFSPDFTVSDSSQGRKLRFRQLPSCVTVHRKRELRILTLLLPCA